MKKLLALLLSLFIFSDAIAGVNVIPTPNAVGSTGSFTSGNCVQFSDSGNGGATISDTGAPCGTGTVTGPGGTNTQVQYNNNGVFAGANLYVTGGTNIGYFDAISFTGTTSPAVAGSYSFNGIVGGFPAFKSTFPGTTYFLRFVPSLNLYTISTTNTGVPTNYFGSAFLELMAYNPAGTYTGNPQPVPPTSGVLDINGNFTMSRSGGGATFTMLYGGQFNFADHGQSGAGLYQNGLYLFNTQNQILLGVDGATTAAAWGTGSLASIPGSFSSQFNILDDGVNGSMNIAGTSSIFQGDLTVGGLDDNNTQFKIFANTSSAASYLMEAVDINGNDVFGIDGDGSPSSGIFGNGSLNWSGITGIAGQTTGSTVNIGGGQGFNVTGTSGVGAGGGFGFSSGAGGVISGTSSGTITAGNGGTTTVTGGVGGNGENLGTGTGKGGVGGGMQITSGQGGFGLATGTGAKGQGGAGGPIAITGATGGPAAATTTANNTGGAGSSIVITSGNGQVGQSAATNNRGGNGGQNSTVGGRGGDASGGVSAIGGNGSTITFSAGQGGGGSGASVTNTNGNGGSVTFRAGAAGGSGTGGVDGSLQFTDAAFANIIAITTGKLGFFSTTPIVQQSGNIITALSNYGLVTSGTVAASNLTGTISAANLPVATTGAQGIMQVGSGLAVSSGTVSSNAVYQIGFQPGLLTAVTNTKGVYGKVSKAATVDNIEGSAILFTCLGNPTVTMYECGTSSTCATPTTIGSVTVTTSGQVFDGTVSNSAITAGDYIAWAISAGTCTSIDISATAQVHSN